MEPTAVGMPELPLDEGWRVLQPEDLLSAEGADEPDQDGGITALLVVPAGVFSALDELARRHVLGTLRGRPALVCGLPLERAGRLVRLLGRVRVALRRVGLHAGEPGDGVLHAVVGMPPGSTHYFSAVALEHELRRAGLQVSSVGLRASDRGPIVCARTKSGCGRTRDVAVAHVGVGHFHVRQHMLMRQACGCACIPHQSPCHARFLPVYRWCICYQGLSRDRRRVHAVLKPFRD